MNEYTVLAMAVSVATNIIFVKWKIERERYSDAILDGLIFAMLIFIFARTVTGLSIATMASSIVSVYLFFSPPKEFFKFRHKRRNH